MTVCRLRKTRIHIYIYTRSGCRFGEIKKRVEGEDSLVKIGHSNEIVFRENYEISLFLPIIERKENIYECIFFRCSRFLTREIVRPQDEVIIETFAIHSFGWHKPGTLS